MSKNTTENKVLTNAEIVVELQKLSAERQAKSKEALEKVNAAWNEYKTWKNDTYKPAREALLKQITDNRLAREAKRELAKKEAAEKAAAKEAEKAAKSAE